jgi:glycosyltransferase involved in cell wall biosynthesis
VVAPANLAYEVRRGIDDAALLALYRESDVLLLPLHDSTANNALLEGMACGLAPIVTDVGGVRDYADDSSAVLAPPGDTLAMVSAITYFLKDRRALRRAQDAARAQAQRHAWPGVAAQLQQVYRHYGAHVEIRDAA